MTYFDRTPEFGKYHQILLPWISAGTTLLALGATCTLAVSGYPAAAVAVASLGAAGSLSVTVVIVRRN